MVFEVRLRKCEKESGQKSSLLDPFTPQDFSGDMALKSHMLRSAGWIVDDG